MSTKIIPQINAVVGAAMRQTAEILAVEAPSEVLRPDRGPITSIGFVYLLANPSMPGLYKVGCTERSPARRAAELSAATACPSPFDVVCFWEGYHFQRFETELHEVLTHHEKRLNDAREFFHGPLPFLVSCIDNWGEFRFGFHITEVGRAYLAEHARLEAGVA